MLYIDGSRGPSESWTFLAEVALIFVCVCVMRLGLDREVQLQFLFNLWGVQQGWL